MTKKILIINGPNLNLLGESRRDLNMEKYTLEEMLKKIVKIMQKLLIVLK